MKNNILTTDLRHAARKFQPLRFIGILCLIMMFVSFNVEAQSFSQSNLDFNGNGSVNQGTSHMFGPDGRLYVLQLNGTIDIFTIQRNAVNDYTVVASEELLLVKNIPNHNDDGSSNAGNNREATGITVVGTAATPIIYATSSDSQVGGPSGDKNLDTNSGVITRLTWNGSTWNAVDIVRGLPRSEENHATNGLEFVTVNSTDFLIVAQGGHTNAGSPSDNFAWTTEYALSAAILSVNLTMLESMSVVNDGTRDYIYDIPTLDDPTRNNANGITDPDDGSYNGIDINDPWGGNDGMNQAMVVLNGPVQVFSPGYRNSFDLTVTQNGKVYATDNGANGGWGGLPVNEGIDGTVTNAYDSNEPGSSSSVGGEQVNNGDHLTMITDNIQSYVFGSFYGGHPAPVRANASAGLFTNPTVNGVSGEVFRTLIYDPDGSTPGSTMDASIALPANWPPVPAALIEPRQGDWRGPGINNPDGPNDVLVVTWGTNTNGIDEYTASNFGGAMQGDLIAGKNGGALRRVQLNSDGSLQQLTNTFASNLGGNSLGITCNSDTDPFPGTIWVATFNGNIVVLEPQDFIICVLPGDPGYVSTADTDSDGYTNQDEIDNKDSIESDEDVICNGGNQPDDFDKSAGAPLVSNLNDSDDDDDGIDDINDPFQLGDPSNSGSDAFNLPVLNDLLSDNPDLQGYLGLGFTGFMNNGDGNGNWLNWLDRRDDPNDPNPNDLLGGAVGAMTMQMTSGTASGNSANPQEKGFQFGVNVDQSTGGFTIESRLFNFNDPLQLYGSNAPAAVELGISIGDGTQSNYIKFVITQNGLQIVQEINNNVQTPIEVAIATGNRPTNDMILFFVVNTVTGVVTAQYKIDNGATQTLGTITAEGNILSAIQNSNDALAVGLIGSSNTAGVEVEGTWDYVYVQGGQPTVVQTLPDLTELIGAAPTSFNLNDYFSDDGGDANLTYSIISNTNSAIGAIVSGNSLDLTFPALAATSVITVRATDSNSLFVEQSFTITVANEPIPILRIRANGATITATDAPNPNWVGITATGAQSGSSNGINYAVNLGNHSTHNIAGRDASVPDYAPQAIFANERWDPEAAPEMQWTFDVTDGDYVVRLYMGNGYAGTGAVGERVFDISMEGQLVENDLDLVQRFTNATGGMIEYPVTVNDGVLNIEFGHVIENPLVNAIEILSGSGDFETPIAVDPIASQSNLEGDLVNLTVQASGGNSNENFAYSATNLPAGIQIEPLTGLIFGTVATGASSNSPYATTITVDKPSSDSVTINIVWNVTDSNTPNTVIYRVNGGGVLTSSTDTALDWEEDQTIASPGGNAGTGAPSTYVNSASEDETFGAVLPGAFVNNTTYPNSLFTTERYNTLVAPANMQWDFPLPNGTYTVNLLFAEVWTGAQSAGIRVFDVIVEEELVLDDFDQTAMFGWATAGVESLTVEVTDGNLDIDFIKGVQNPNIKAIEIISAAPVVNDVWTNITNVSEHTPRHENSFVQVGDKFYLFGGRESSDKMDIYDYQTDTWSEAASTAPFEFNHFQAVAYEGLIWVIGSFKDNGFPNETPSDFIYMYDPVSDTWIQGPAIPTNRKRGSAGLVLYNNKFYVIAGNTDGHDGGYIPWFDEFDPATGIWTTLADAPNSRDHFHATVADSKLYVVGGRLSGGTGGTFAPIIAEVDVYDFSNSSWSTLPVGSNIPTPRAASGTVTFQDKIFVIGGEGDGQAYANTDVLDPSTGTWTSVADLNNARHGTQAIVSGDGIWISSGSPNQGGGNQTNMEVYGTDNPSGTAVVAGTLTVATDLTVPTGDTEIFTLDNTGGNQGIYITSISPSGTNASNFSVVGSTSFLVPAGTSVTVEVAHVGAEGDIASLDIGYGNASTSSVSLISGAAASSILYRVNSGGVLVAATDTANPDWTTDTVAAQSAYLTGLSGTGNSIYSQTSGSAHVGPIIMTDPSLPIGTPTSIFQTERYDNAVAAPQMLWQFPIPIGTQIEVRLYFAEIFGGINAAGGRVFDVSMEGSVPPVYNDIDAFARNGALGAFMLSHTLTMTDDILDIEFIHLGMENPAIKAIEIIDISGGTNPGLEPIVTNPGGQVGVEGDLVNLQIQALDANTVACGSLNYEATNLPVNLSIDPLTGLISGTLLAGTGSGTAGAFIESGGLVIIEAETDFVDTPSGWNLTNEGGVDFLVASTDHFGNTNGEAITYAMEIATPGVYRFHMKSNLSGTVTSDENDSWFKINNTSDVHFFAVEGGSLSGTTEFESILGGAATSKTIYYPAGNAQNRPNHGNENPGNSGFFKVYRGGGGGNKWDGQTIDNNGFPIYAYFPNAGIFNIQMSERSAGHKVDRFALAQIDEVGTSENSAVLTQLNGPQSQQSLGGSPGASEDSPYDVAINVTDSCDPALSTEIAFTWNVTATPVGDPSALVQVNAGSGITSSTYGNNSFVISNTGDDNIVNITFNTDTGYMTDIVFDPIGTAGDLAAKCLTTGGAGNTAAEVGITVPANGGSDTADCESIFAQQNNGVDDSEGYDVMTLDFTDFEPGESYAFGVDMDPTTIKGDLTSGDAGSVSGFEFIGGTVSIEFASGVIYTSSLFDEGSLGGSDAIIDGVSNALVAPSILVDNLNTSRLVTVANQIVQVTGEPNALVTLLRVDGRLYIDPGNPSVGYDIDLFEANEAMAKQLYAATLDASGIANIPVTLTQTTGATGTPNGGLNHFIAVVNGPSGENSVASNVIVLEFDPNAIIGPSVLLEVTPDADLDASTFGGSSLIITNNSSGALQITKVSIDLSTAVLPDMIWDPTGAGGDATAKCFEPNTGATAVGLIVPTDVCVDPFSQARNGGFDIMSIDFSEFDPGESFDFSVDIDPNSIQGVAGAGAAGSVSGYELIGASVSIEFSDGSTIVSSLYEDGSLGGSQTVAAADAPTAPSISVSGVTGQATVNDLNQTVTLTGTAGDVVSLLVMDSRLFIASNDPPFNVADPTYYGNEAMSGKTLYTGLIGAGGTVDIPITLLQTQIGDGTPDGGLNQLVAVTSDGAYVTEKQVSQTSNVVTLLYDPNAVLGGDITLSYTLEARTDQTIDLTVNVYPQGSTVPAYQFTPTGSAAGDAIVTGLTPGIYEVAVKSPIHLQRIEIITVVEGVNSLVFGELKAGDADNNNRVELQDFSILTGTFNVLPNDPNFDPRADFNGDDEVGLEDFSLLSGNFNTNGESIED